jgi:hypothetical protein
VSSVPIQLLQSRSEYLIKEVPDGLSEVKRREKGLSLGLHGIFFFVDNAY